MVEPQMLVDPPKEVSHKRKPAWVREAIQDAEKYGAPEGSLRESKRPRTYSSYVALLLDIIDAEPSSFDEAVGKQVWKDAMHEEYQSIMKNDVWEVVPRPKGEVCRDFQVDLQNKTCSRWKYREVQSSILGLWIFSKRRDRL